MDFQDFETAITARLQARLTSVEVEFLPDRPESYVLIHPNGAVLVGYARSTYKEPEGSGKVHQQGRIEIDVMFKFNSMRNDHGLYDTLKDTRTALIGYVPDANYKLFLKSEQFLDYDADNGIWTWAQTWAVKDWISQV